MKLSPTITVDTVTDTIYLKLTDHKVCYTNEPDYHDGSGDVYVDRDADGDLVRVRIRL